MYAGQRGGDFLVGLHRADIYTRPSILSFLIVRHGTDIEQVVPNGVSLQFSQQARQDIKSNIGGNVGWYEIKQPRTRASMSPEKTQLLRGFFGFSSKPVMIPELSVSATPQREGSGTW